MTEILPNPHIQVVHPRIDPPSRLLALAELQAGVVSSQQALSFGMRRNSVTRLVDQGSWQRLTEGIFLLGVGQPSWSAQAWAGVLLGGPEARLGFASAGHLWKLIPDPPTTLQVLVPSNKPRRPQHPWVFIRERPGTRSERSPGYPPRTTVEDTVIDIGSDCSKSEIVGLVTTAVQNGKTTPARLLEQLNHRARVHHRQVFVDLLGDVAEGAQSPLELAYLRDVERRHGLPRAERQHRSRAHRAVRDLRYREFGLLIELDGQTHIAGRFRDMRRDNAALLDGESTLRYGWHDVTERPCEVAREVAEVLTMRGWTGTVTRCPWCRT